MTMKARKMMNGKLSHNGNQRGRFILKFKLIFFVLLFLKHWFLSTVSLNDFSKCEVTHLFNEKQYVISTFNKNLMPGET